jgi:hypothetical protein
MTYKKRAIDRPVQDARSKLVYEAFQEEPDDRDLLFQSSVMAHSYLPRAIWRRTSWQTESGKMPLHVMPTPVIDPRRTPFAIRRHTGQGAHHPVEPTQGSQDAELAIEFPADSSRWTSPRPSSWL